MVVKTDHVLGTAAVAAPTGHAQILAWVAEVVDLTAPEDVVWCDGTRQEWDRLTARLVDKGTFVALSAKPNSFWSVSDPEDVARVEDRTFICSRDRRDAGPTNNWVDPVDMRTVMTEHYRGAMAGRTMYVLAFCMGPLDAEDPKYGVQITDSEYVAVSMQIMTRSLSAIFFGGRRATTIPLIAESFDWTHGVFTASVLSSETTAAAAGQLGVVRRDPMAMLPFLGYHVGDHFAHWLRLGDTADPAKLPKIFQVNWFRRDTDGRFLWPGFGDNIRVLEWALERIEGTAAADCTAVGYVPLPHSLDLSGFSDTEKRRAYAALEVHHDEWADEVASIEDWYTSIGSDTLPAPLCDQLAALKNRLAHTPARATGAS
ncbi:phosphoenolpyruvate carboxykinase domain-containing protein [Nocardia testacea]|uniref:phosphoenolpyruvate carboxykinase domain-containing protein n=1 Tax=Nocardia testacea TaxID=248551 RepID=UPI003C2D86B5